MHFEEYFKADMTLYIFMTFAALADEACSLIPVYLYYGIP